MSTSGGNNPNGSGSLPGTRILVFFHRFATTRKKKNEIVKLKDNRGIWCTWNQVLQDLIIDYTLRTFSLPVEAILNRS